MARSKRRRLASSPSPLVSSTPAQSQEHNRHKTTTSQTVGNQADHSEYKQQTTDVDSTTPGGTQQTKPDLSDEQELHKAKSKHEN
ncbi:hypothetical protein Pst134EA_005234 [Puccinia striiformis f. sp. tritici]|uniref:hypothetical protein n=1 Tax=Puccinia striiformis f. sp. tritici TaxID=168172 RepID=UPI000A12872F|nr:hypothetical protein Pst134EA_005234 [Puccinia striiformis f. sp. tritici]KAH9471334.1 hypothetical protein Pst134EA_005234 [Puccinia striiformis f. sp. tritici]